MNQPSAIGSTVARFDLGANYTLDSTDTYYFYHYDEAGNVILITDKNGNVVDHFEQDAWGNDLNSTFNTARAISQHQTSKFYDPTTNLYFFGARWYYPEIGRFISVSPLAPTGEEEYVYCGSDPINYCDQDGECAVAVLSGWIGTDILVPDPSDLALPKWIVYGAATIGAYALDKLIIIPLFESKIDSGKCDASKKNDGYKVPVPKLNDKERSNKKPSWAEGKRPKIGENGKEFAKRLLDEKYGPGNWKEGPDTEYNWLRKHGDRGFKDPNPKGNK
jgi:RHS repeat-associated protein